MILFRRYVLLEDWDGIADHIRMTKRWVYTRHRNAVDRLDVKISTEKH